MRSYHWNSEWCWGVGRHDGHARALGVKLVLGDGSSLTKQHRQNHTHTEEEPLSRSKCLPPRVKLSVACLSITSAPLLALPSWALSSLSDSQTPQAPRSPQGNVWWRGGGAWPWAQCPLYLPTTQLPAFFPCLSQSPAEEGGLSSGLGAGPMGKRP